MILNHHKCQIFVFLMKNCAFLDLLLVYAVVSHHIYRKYSFKEYFSLARKWVISEYNPWFFYNEKLWILRIVACVHTSKFDFWYIFIKFILNLYLKYTSVKIENEWYLNTFSRVKYLFFNIKSLLFHLFSPIYFKISRYIFEFQLW